MSEFASSHEPSRQVLLDALAASCSEAVRDAEDWYGRTAVTGIVVNSDQYSLTVDERQPSGVEEDEGIGASSHAGEHVLIEGAAALALYGIELCTRSGNETHPALAVEPAGYYYVEEHITEIPGYRGSAYSGRISVMRIQRPVDAGGRLSEMVTATSISLHAMPGQEEGFLYAGLWSRDGSVVSVDVMALSPEDQAHYFACLEMFGQNSAASQLVEGLFVNEQDLESRLEQIREATLAVGLYAPEEVDEVLGHVRRMGTAAKQSRDAHEDVTDERIRRLTAFARSQTST